MFRLFYIFGARLMDVATAIAILSVLPFVALMIHYSHRTMRHYLRIDVVASVTLWCPSLNPVVAHFGTEKN